MEAQKDSLSPGQMLIEGLYLLPGTKVRLVKIDGANSSIATGAALEGTLDSDVKIGQPIYLDNKKSNTSKIIAVKKEGARVFFKTEKSVYELVPPSSVVTEKNKSEIQINLERKIETLLKKAQENALDEKVIGGLIARRRELNKQQRTQVVNEELQAIDQKLKRQIVTVETIVEFKILMEKTGRNYYAVMGTVAHENSHGNKAGSIGAIHSGYSLLVTKKDNDFGYQPIALTNVNNMWDTKTQINANIAIANAPKEYGNKLSPGDEELIKALEQQLKDL